MRKFWVMGAVLTAVLSLGACGDEGSDGDGDVANNGVDNNDTGNNDTDNNDPGNNDTNNDTDNNAPNNDGPCPGVECGPGTFLDEGACQCELDPEADLEATEEDFECLQLWDRIRRFRITNKLGRMEETLAVANNPDGGVYPVGTIIQLVPQEAMVKRREGFSPETGDWEFFFLTPSSDGTEIVSRGTTDVVNSFGGNCFECHAKAEPQWDLICEQDHGCDPIPIGEGIINNLQDNDPRCP